MFKDILDDLDNFDFQQNYTFFKDGMISTFLEEIEDSNKKQF